MTKRRKGRAPTTAKPAPTGRPSKYRPEYGEMLIRHLSEGQTVESFGSIVDVCRDTLYAWAAEHPAFSDAKKVGEAKREAFLIRMGHGIALGQHRRVVSEKVHLDRDGRPLLDAQGRAVVDREYAPAHTSSAVWIFMMKNLCKWRDRQDLQVAGTPGGEPVHLRRSSMTREERVAELAALAASRMECGDD